MRVDTGFNHVYANQQHNQSMRTAETKTPGSEANPATQRGEVEKVDFTNMSRQEMRDWVNRQIRSGEMSLDESTPFAGMTLQVSAHAFQPAGAAADSAPINFIERVQSGIEGALSRNNTEEAKLLRSALDTLLRFQGQTTGVNISV